MKTSRGKRLEGVSHFKPRTKSARHIRSVERQGSGTRVVAAVGDGVVALDVRSTDGDGDASRNGDPAQSSVEGASGGGGNKDGGHGGGD